MTFGLFRNMQECENPKFTSAKEAIKSLLSPKSVAAIALATTFSQSIHDLFEHRFTLWRAIALGLVEAALILIAIVFAAYFLQACKKLDYRLKK